MDSQYKNQDEDDWIQDAVAILKEGEEIPFEDKTIAGEPVDSNTPIFTLDNLLKRHFLETGWIVESLLPAQGLVALSGAPGSYKSWITEHLAICVASGTSVFGQYSVTPGSVLIIDKENNLRLIKERFLALGGNVDLNILFYNLESFDFLTDSQENLNLVVSIVKENNIKLVVLDSLIRAHKQDENSASGMSLVFEALRKIQDSGAAIIFTHHHRKQSFFNRSGGAESLRGSSDILAAVDCHLAVDKMEDGIKITQTKLRQQQAIKPFKVRLEQAADDPTTLKFIYLGDVDEDKQRVGEAREAILEILGDGVEHSRQDLLDKLTGIFGRPSVDLALKSFTPEEVVIRTGEHNKKYYSKVGLGQLNLEEEV